MEQKVVRLDEEAYLRDAIEELKDCSEETQRQACDAFERKEECGPKLAQELRKRLGLKPRPIVPFRRRILGKPVEQQKPVEPEPEPTPQLPVSYQPKAVIEEGRGWEQDIAEMNRQHAIIENVGGKAVIASWEPATNNLKKMVVVFQNKESFIVSVRPTTPRI